MNTFKTLAKALKVTAAGGAAALTALPLLASSPATAAGGVTMSYSPATTKLQHGSTAAITLSINAGTNKISAAQACVTFDSSLITLVNINYTGTPLDSTTPSESSTDCAAGEAQISRYSLSNHPGGSFILATLTFKAVSPNGTATIGIGGKSFAYTEESNGTSSSLDIAASTNTSVVLAAAVPAGQDSDTSKDQGRLPAISDSGRPESDPSLAASSDISQPPQKPTANNATQPASQTDPGDYRFLYIGGGVAILILAAITVKLFLLPKFRTARPKTPETTAPIHSESPDEKE